MSQPAKRILVALTLFIGVLVASPTHRAMAATVEAAPIQVAPEVVIVESVVVVEQTAKVTVTVVSGDTLSAIHSRVCGNGSWESTWKENPFIVNANLIYPGQVLTLSCTAVAQPQAATPPVQQQA